MLALTVSRLIPAPYRQDVELLTQGSAPGGERRICSPRRPGRRLTDPPPEVREVGQGEDGSNGYLDLVKKCSSY